MTIQWLHRSDFWFWAVLILAVGALIWGFWKGGKMPWFRGLISLRIVVFGLLLLGMFQPHIRSWKTETIPLDWNVYVDNSISMGFHQTPSLVSLQNGLQDLVATWRNQTNQLQLFTFSNDVDKVVADPIRADGSATDLGRVIRNIRSQTNRLAGAILITDGQLTQGEDPLDLVGDLSIPIYTIGVGDSTAMVDVAIRSVDVPTVAIKGEPVDANVTLSNTGHGENRLNVSMYSESKMVGSQFVTLSGGGAQTQVKYRFTPENIGTSHYRVQVSSLPDEVNIENNRQAFDVTVLKDRYNVALITGSPCFNTRVLKSLLGQLPRVHVDSYLQKGNEFVPPIKTFWETPYELIVFDNFPTQPLSSAWQRILGRKIMAQKSSLAWFAGPDMNQDAVSVLYPFFYVQSTGAVLDASTGYDLQFTNRINTLPFLASFSAMAGNGNTVNFPPLQPGLQIEGTRNDQWILADLSSSFTIPALLIGEKESFRYAVWTPQDLSSLHFKLIGTPDEKKAQRLFGDILSWLMKTAGDNDMYFRMNKTSFQQGELMMITGNRIVPTNPNARAVVHITKDGNTINSAELEYQPDKDRWAGQIYAPSPGHYQYEVDFQDGSDRSKETGEFRVQESQVEMNRVVLNSDLLKAISEKTGGAFYTWNQKVKMKDVVENKVRTDRKTADFNYLEHPLIWVLILVVFSGEWILRRILGLP